LTFDVKLAQKGNLTYSNGEFGLGGCGNSPKRKTLKVPRGIQLDHTLEILPYHYVMINDHQRCYAFRDGLKAAICQATEARTLSIKERLHAMGAGPAPGTVEWDAWEPTKEDLASGRNPQPLVLDIGTGSGLLSMCAAQLPSRAVVTCETDSAMCVVARQCIADNHLEERITVLNTNSKKMAPPEQTPAKGEVAGLTERAEVLVAEIFGDDPLNEGVIATVEHAKEHLLVPGAIIVPGEIVVYGYLAESPVLSNLTQASQNAGGSGLKFCPLNDLAKFRLYIRAHSYPHTKLTDTTELLRISLAEDFDTEGRNTVTLDTTAAGKGQFLIFWFDLVFPGGTVYSTSADTEMVSYEHKPWSRAWNQVAYDLHHTFDGVPDVTAGTSVSITSQFRNDRMWFNVQKPAKR